MLACLEEEVNFGCNDGFLNGAALHFNNIILSHLPCYGNLKNPIDVYDAYVAVYQNFGLGRPPLLDRRVPDVRPPYLVGYQRAVKSEVPQIRSHDSDLNFSSPDIPKDASAISTHFANENRSTVPVLAHGGDLDLILGESSILKQSAGNLVSGSEVSAESISTQGEFEENSGNSSILSDSHENHLHLHGAEDFSNVFFSVGTLLHEELWNVADNDLEISSSQPAKDLLNDREEASGPEFSALQFVEPSLKTPLFEDLSTLPNLIIETEPVITSFVKETLHTNYFLEKAAYDEMTLTKMSTTATAESKEL